jgi:hypothetical protein
MTKHIINLDFASLYQNAVPRLYTEPEFINLMNIKLIKERSTKIKNILNLDDQENK